MGYTIHSPTHPLDRYPRNLVAGGTCLLALGGQSWFEAVCVTTVILAPGACGLGLRAALLATTSLPPAATAGVFQKSPISCYLSYLRARDLSKIDLFMKFDVFGVRNYEIGV